MPRFSLHSEYLQSLFQLIRLGLLIALGLALVHTGTSETLIHPSLFRRTASDMFTSKPSYMGTGKLKCVWCVHLHLVRLVWLELG